MQIDGNFIVKITENRFYRVPVSGEFTTRQELEAAVRAGCVEANLRPDMPPEERHFSSVREDDNLPLPHVHLQDEAAVEAELAGILRNLPKSRRSQVLDKVKAAENRPIETEPENGGLR